MSFFLNLCHKEVTIASLLRQATIKTKRHTAVMAVAERVGVLRRSQEMMFELKSPWDQLSETTRSYILFDLNCPAGGKREEDYHRDNSRYWEK